MKGQPPTLVRPAFTSLCWEEPFRVFFPAGLLLGVIGVLLWPMFLLGFTQTYPAIAHARLMIEGMMTCFIFGFLGTAGPRVMSVPHFTRAEVLRALLLIIAASFAHLAAFYTLGDSFFLAALLLFALSLGRRFVRREDSPPPNFALVGLGILNGIAGTALIIWSEATNFAPAFYRIGSSFLNLGFVLLPLLGVAPFFLRRLLDLPTEEATESHHGAKLALALAVGLTIDASFVLELFSANTAIAWLRCACAIVWLALTLPLRGSNLLATYLRMGLAAIVAALGLMAVLPAYRISALHVIFIGGFSVAIFSVATRVVLGHSGRLALLRQRRWLLWAVLALLVLAMISRFSADFVPMRNEHLIGAAACWLVAALVWGRWYYRAEQE